jgi:glycosyltransferase involved in cell wall biosynthesis
VRDDLGFTGEVRVIPNGIDVARFSVVPRAHHNIRILYSGNLSKRKGADLLGPIAEKLDMGIELWIASGLKGRDYARQRSPNMKTLGSISYDEMPALYNQVDILVVPSLREGFCLVAAEAMACGLPVVASKCSAMPELIVEGESGFLVEPEDASGFADRLNHLASDNELRRRIGIYNRQRIVQHFNEETMVEGYADLFAELD